MVGGGVAVDVIDADTGAPDRLEVFGGGEDFRGHFRLRADDKAVVVADDFREFLGGQPGVDVDGDSLCGTQGGHTFF